MKKTLNTFEINDLCFARRGILAAAEVCDHESPDWAKKLRGWAAEIESSVDAAHREKAAREKSEVDEDGLPL